MSVTWPQVLPAVLMALVAIVGPGAIALRAWGIGWVTAVLGAPVVSTALLILAGAVVGAAGLAWAPALGLGLVAVLLAGLVLLGLWWRGRAPMSSASRNAPDQAVTPGGTSRTGEAMDLPLAAVVGAVGLAAAYLLMAGAITSPMAVPQMPDVVFHLGAVEWMTRHGSASVFDVYRYAQLDGPLAYPGAFHVVAAVLTSWTGLPVTATWHALLLVVVGVVWPFGVMLLARVVFGRGSGVLVAAGLLTLVFSAFPTSFLAWGPLWSNLLANALLPAVLASAVCGIAPDALIAMPAFGPRRPLALGYAAVGLLVLIGTQPNALASGAVMGCCLVAASLPHWRAAVRVKAPWTTALHDVVSVFDGSWAQAVAPSLLVVLGGITMVRGRGRWIVGSFAVLTVVFLALYAVNGPIVRLFTWLWWNDHYRIRAALVLPAVLCATAGALAVGAWLARRAWMSPPRYRREGAAALVVLVVIVALQGGIPAHRAIVEATYAQDGPDFSWVTPREYAALAQLAPHVPEGSVVAANPYRGGMFFYVAGGVEVLYPTENSLMLPDRRLIGTSLHLLETVPAVCSALARQRVDYVLTGGEMHIWGVLDHTPEYLGVDLTATHPRFEVVAQVGPYTLRRVPACPGGPQAPMVGPAQPSPRPSPSTAAR